MNPHPKSFADLNLSAPLLRAISSAGYVNPTPIQERAIPEALHGHDLLAQAQTGTGKTAAFALPILEGLLPQDRIKKQSCVRALILAPTRELAAQIGNNINTYAGKAGPKRLVVFGGVGKQGQIDALRKRGIEILVATPGRLLDLLGDGALSLDDVQTLVLDEADRMLDMGFIPDVRRIVEQLPKKRQTMLFSATMPKAVQNLASQLLHNPKRVSVEPKPSQQPDIEQRVVFVDKKKKFPLLLDLLRSQGADRCLVFTRTKHGANRVVHKLVRAGIDAAAIHGGKSQGGRVRVLKDFKAGRVQVVVATDLAARGIDIHELPYVINYDIPNEAETYVHRIGRTGRAGHAGVAISLCSGDERGYLNAIEKLVGKALVEQQGEHRQAAPAPHNKSSKPAHPPKRTRRSGPRSSNGPKRDGASGPRRRLRPARRTNRHTLAAR